MNKFIWKLRFAWFMHTRGNLRLSLAWGIAEEAFINTSEGPIESALEEMSYWGEQ